MEVAGNGYINVRLDRGAYAYGISARESCEVCKPAPARSSSSTPISTRTKRRTSGTLRNAILGDTFVRMLRAIGQSRRSAELHRQHGRPGCRRRRRLPASANRPPPNRCAASSQARASIIYCWDLYAKVTSLYFNEHPGSHGAGVEDPACHRSRRRRRRPKWRTCRRRYRERPSRRPCCGLASSTTSCRAKAKSFI